MDIFYKIHKIMNLEYHAHIKPMMHFIDWFIYKNMDRGLKITPKMQKLVTEEISTVYAIQLRSTERISRLLDYKRSSIWL